MTLDDTTLGVELHKLDLHNELSFEAEQRYCWYRRRGLTPVEAFECARTFMANMADQRARRKGHDTGSGEVEAPPSRLPDRPGTGRREHRYLEWR